MTERMGVFPPTTLIFDYIVLWAELASVRPLPETRGEACVVREESNSAISLLTGF